MDPEVMRERGQPKKTWCDSVMESFGLFKEYPEDKDQWLH